MQQLCNVTDEQSGIRQLFLSIANAKIEKYWSNYRFTQMEKMTHENENPKPFGKKVFGISQPFHPFAIPLGFDKICRW